MLDRELYHAQPLAANAAGIANRSLAGFICTVSGTITATEAPDPQAVSRVPLNAFPVTAGQIYMFRIIGGPRPMTVQLGGGAAGTLLT